MGSKTQKIPASALNFNMGVSDYEVSFKEVDGKKTPSLKMVGYSGKPFLHAYWGNLAIDLTGMSFPKTKFPILRDHDTNRIVAYTKTPDVSDGKLSVTDAKFMKTPTAEEFLQLSEEGFPFEASIRVDPRSLKLEFLDKGQSAEVNGHTVQGPGTIFRKSVFKEVSVCVFGYDSNTSSSAFAEGKTEFEVTFEVDDTNTSKEATMPSLAEFKEQDPEGYKKLMDEVATAVGTKFKADLQAKDEEISALKTENAKFSANGNETEERMKKMERELAMFRERSIKDSATAILHTKLSASTLPERAYSKVMVGYNQFVKDDVLDTVAFSEAVDKEIESWQSIFTDIAPNMLGGGGTPSTPNGKTEFTEEMATERAKEHLASLGLDLK